MSSNAVSRRGDARNRGLRVGVEQVLNHHHRVVALLHRLAIEEVGEPWKRLRVVVDGVGDVLLGGGELVGDLLSETLDKALCGHLRAPQSWTNPAGTLLRGRRPAVADRPPVARPDAPDGPDSG